MARNSVLLAFLLCGAAATSAMAKAKSFDDGHAAIAAAKAKDTLCLPRSPGGKVAARYDPYLTDDSSQVVETASVDARGNMHFSYWLVKNGLARGYISTPNKPKLSEIRQLYNSSNLTQGLIGQWLYVYEESSKAFFTTCHY